MRRNIVNTTLISLAPLLAAFVLAYVFLDRPIAWGAQGLKGTWIHDAAGVVSQLANSTYYYLLLGTGFVVGARRLLRDDNAASAPGWARGVLYVCLAVGVSMILVEGVKYICGRCRPQLLFDGTCYGFTWFSHVWERNSFPSGHTTRIFALSTALALLFRRWTAFFIGLACLVGAARVLALKHYPSDVLAGAWLGAVTAYWTHALWRNAQRFTNGGQGGNTY